MGHSNLASGYYHDARQSLSLGCSDCHGKLVCGGLQVSSSFLDCMDLCQCTDTSRCSYVCPAHPERFVSRVWEIGGFGLASIPRTQRAPLPQLPRVIPLIYHGSHRQYPLKAPVVAIKLHDLVDYSSGQLKFESKADIAAWFKLAPEADLIISGIDKDELIEPYWSVVYKSKIIDQLWRISPMLITVPNFSMFLNIPQWDNLHNMKRIALCWHELASRGLPTSLHLNARTDRDWERWTDFIGERDEVTSVTVEFATGLARKERGQWHVEKLLELAAQVPRTLHLILRGGVRHWGELAGSFGAISLLDSTSFMKTMYRRRLQWMPGQSAKWKAVTTEVLEPLDDLLQHNVSTMAEMRAYQICH
jgi:Domain of unknown function (DUF4417)